MEKPTLKNTFTFPCLLDLGRHSTTKKYGEPCIEYRPLICNNITGRNPPKSLISLLTPEESFAVFLKAVLAAARSSVLESPAMASSAKPLSFSKTKQKKEYLFNPSVS